jgi:hypothetical protein
LPMHQESPAEAGATSGLVKIGTTLKVRMAVCVSKPGRRV